MQVILNNTRPAEGFFAQRAAAAAADNQAASSTAPFNASGPEIGPIVVICFTNHALDQFLEGLVKAGITDGLVRVGGQGRSEMLQVQSHRPIWETGL